MAAHEIVGISGPSASGKDTAAEHLVSLGFLHVSTADIIRAEASRLYGTSDQYTLRQVGHMMREKNGPGAVVLQAITQYQEVRSKWIGVVIGSIRAVGTAEAVIANGGLMMSLDAPSEVRYSRLVARGRIGESTSYEEFLDFEEAETNGTVVTGQNLNAVTEISQVQIYNDTDLPTFLAAIEQAVGI